jgi:hypothetical protein
VFSVLIAIAAFILGIRAGIELGYRRAKKRFLLETKSSRRLPGS